MEHQLRNALAEVGFVTVAASGEGWPLGRHSLPEGELRLT